MPENELIYPPSSLQQGMLFHWLFAPHCGVDIEQVIGTLHDPLDEEKFRQAWATVANRHEVLRCCFEWSGRDAPAQIVRDQTNIDWQLHDWRQLTASEQAEKLEQYLEQDRRLGFTMNRDPLMRLALFRCGPDLHKFVWTFHHAILDGRCLPVVVPEVFECYRALVDGDEPDLSPPIPFGTFLNWLQERPRDHEQPFWSKELAGFLAPTPISNATRRSSSQIPGPQLLREQYLSAELTERLHWAAESLSVTMNTLVQTAWALLLASYDRGADGNGDVVFGITRACRHDTVPGAESIVGLFINSIPLRVRWHAGTTTRQLLKQVRAKHVALRAVEQTPLADIKRWSEVDARLPLFESLVVFEKHNFNEQFRVLGGEWLRRSFEHRGQTNYPLTLIAYDGEELMLRIEADSQRFDRATISQILNHLAHLLSQMAARLDAPVDTLSIMTETERDELLTRWNQTQRDYPGDVCLHEWFEAQVERSADRVALIFEDGQLTYSQLNARANQLAHYLRDQGVGPESRVGVFMHRSLEMVISLYAILKAGGAYVPLDPDYPRQRLAFMWEDAECDLLLTQQHLREAVPRAASQRTVAVDDQWSMIAGHSVENPSRLAGPSNLAYIIYTSGSTGKPKGVMNEHLGICNRLLWMQDAFGLDQDDCVLQKTPLSFDVSVWEFFWPLSFGAKLVVARPDGHRDPDYLVRVIRQHQVTTIHFVPSMLQAFLRADDLQACSCLKRVICSGEALGHELQERFFERLDAELHNLYGPTEAAVDVTHWHCRRSDDRQLVPIGKPIANTQIHILDTSLNPVPVGMAGELHIGGVQVARGYLNRGELTAERFIADPFSDTPGARLYKTGDLARWLTDGTIEYLGRMDHQVKVRGFRIELGEIESVLLEHPAVREAIVMAREDDQGGKRLAAYLVCHPPQPAASELRQHLAGKLPDHMIPSAFVHLDGLPLTPNGKVDRKALPAPDDQHSASTNPFVAPRTPVEEKLAAIWCDVLRIKCVGVHDNYFELGGDSIQSTMVVSAARRIGLHLTPRQLFECPTIAELAVAADQTMNLVQHQQGPVEGESPLTPIQHWFFEQQLADAHHFNQAFLFNVPPDLDEDALRGAIAAVQSHHDALRLRFCCQSGVWQQRFADCQACEPPLERIDLSSISDAEIEAEIARTAAKFQSSLDLEKGPLWRVLCFRLADGSRRVLIIVHHLVIDGVSWRILLEDLEQAYQQSRKGQPIVLPPKTTSIKEWAERLQTFAGSNALASESSHWNRLGKLENASLPSNDLVASDHRFEESEATARRVTVSLTPEETHDLLHRVPQAYNTMINDVLLSALAISAASSTGTRNLLVNVEGHGREDLFDDVDLTRTLGWFTTIYPVHLELPASSLLQDTLKAIKEQLRSVPRRGIGYGLLRYLAEDEQPRDTLAPPSLSRCEPEILFNYLGRFDDIVRDSELFEFAKEPTGELISEPTALAAGVQSGVNPSSRPEASAYGSAEKTNSSAQPTGAWRSGRQRRRQPLEINGMVIHDRLEVEWTYSPSRYRPETIDAIAGEFLRALRELIDHCISDGAGGRTPSDFPLCGLDQATLDRLLADRSNVEDIFPLSPIQTLFLARAASDDASVLDHWQCTLSGELNIDAFQQAWQAVFGRHAILRTSIQSDGLSEPLQVVEREVHAPWTIDDWSNRPADQHQESWQQLLKEDRAIGMALDQAPLSRFTLVRLDDSTYRFLWSVPALLLDGWSWPLVFADVSQVYQDYLRGEPPRLEQPPSYRRYIAWLRDETSGPSEQAFWQSQLKGVKEPTPLLTEPPAAFDPDAEQDTDPFQRISTTLDEPVVAGLRATIRNRRTTIGTIAQAAWSLVLSRQCDRQDVVFGAAFSGRPTDLAGAESIVGPLVNHLPVRVTFDREQTLDEFLTAAHDRLLQLTPYQFVPSEQIQSWSDIGWQHRLFNSLIVVQNYVVKESARNLGPDVCIGDFDGPIHSNFPLLVLIEPDAPWRISMIFDRRVISTTAVERWQADLVQVLQSFTDDLDARLDSVMGRLSAPVRETHADRKRFVQSQNYVPPRTPTEIAVERVWRETIDLDRISIEENLFDLGVHSILVVQLHRKLQEDLGKQIGLVTLFRYPTIYALAQHLDSGARTSARLEQSWDRGRQQRQVLASMKNARARLKR